ncbi:MAG: aldolase, partial [Candidatus Wildermuthbacteria bacterium RIFCSPLOWO2_12_FULL_40_9]
MTKINKRDIKVPLDVPSALRAKYVDNYLAATQQTGRLMLFAGDQKIEHLNKDFFGEDIHLDDSTPEHLFQIASKARIGIFATQLGLIARYGQDYRNVRYLTKLNSKSNLVKTEQKDPNSPNIWTVEEVLDFQKNSGLKIVGVGYTVYLGSECEAEMIRGAAKMIHDAHKNGLITVLWMYPRGKAVQDEKDSHLIAGAAGVGA